MKDFIENKNHFLLLLLVLVISFVFHCSLYFILDTSQYNFYDTDTWYSVRQIDRLTHGEDIQYDTLLNYPTGRSIDWGISLPVIGSFIVEKTDTPLDIFNKVGFLSPVLSLLFAIVVYFLVLRLFSENVGIYSAIMISVGTGIFFQNCLFGIIDHHLLESIFFTILILCLLLVIKKRILLWIFPALACGIVLYFTSVLWVLYYSVTGICIGVFVLCYIWSRNKNIASYLIILLGISCVFCFWYFIDSYWISRLGWYEPIAEMSFSNPLLFLIRFNILLLPLIVGISIFILSKKETMELSFILVVFTLFVLVLRFTRVEYAFVPLVIILSSYYLDKYFSLKMARILISVFLVFSFVIGGIVISNLAANAKDNTGWNGALTFLQHQDRGVVLSWWDYGHWIVAVSNQPPFTDPFQDNARIAASVFTGDPILGSARVKDHLIKYVVVTKNDERFYDSMVWYSGSSVSYDKSYLRELVEENEFRDKLVFENTLVRIYSQ